MTEKQKRNEARAFLQRYRDAIIIIERYGQMLVNVNDDINHPPISSQIGRDEIRSSGVSLGAATLVYRKCDIEEQLGKMTEAALEEMQKVKDVLHKVHASEGKGFLIERYIMGKSMKEIQIESSYDVKRFYKIINASLDEVYDVMCSKDCK